MPRPPIDPSRLKGEPLNRWYLRTPDEIEAERRAAEDQRHRDFFDDPATSTQGAQQYVEPEGNPNSDVFWVANGYGGYRGVRAGQSDFLATLQPDGADGPPDYLPDNPAESEAGDFIEIGNPHNPRLRREWEVANRRAWPRTADGRPFDVAHRRAIADGGTNTLDNIEPMDPAKHRASHKEDSSRWGKRPSIARAFGGKVEPPLHASRPTRGPTVRGFGFLGPLSNITGFLSGRIRSDTPIHTWNDLLGLYSEDDLLPPSGVV